MSKQPAKTDCDGKPRFTSKRLANKVAGRIARREGVPMNVYGCPHCHGLHVGADWLMKDRRRA